MGCSSLSTGGRFGLQPFLDPVLDFLELGLEPFRDLERLADDCRLEYPMN